MKIDISKIKISDRIRTDAGNLDELANDIKENGLITPIAVTEDMELLAGWRRLYACKKLGMTEIEANVMSPKDALAKLKIEISENENRKSFTFNERIRWAELLEAEHKKTAQENSMANLKRGNEDNSPSVRNLTVGRIDDYVAKAVGFGSRDTLHKAEYIWENASPEMIKSLDDGQLSINAAYMSLKRENERLKSENDMLEGLEEEASNKFDSLEMEAQQLREENWTLKRSMKDVDHVELRKEISDTRLALRDMEEQKVAAEMLADKRLKEVEKAKTERKAIMDSFDAYKAHIAETSSVQNSNLAELLAGLSMLRTLASHLGGIDTSSMSGKDIDTVRGAITEVSETLADISNHLGESAA